MPDVLRFDLADGGSVLVEVDGDEPGIARASRVGNLIESASASFDRSPSAKWNELPDRR